MVCYVCAFTCQRCWNLINSPIVDDDKGAFETEVNMQKAKKKKRKRNDKIGKRRIFETSNRLNAMVWRVRVSFRYTFFVVVEDDPNQHFSI